MKNTMQVPNNSSISNLYAPTTILALIASLALVTLGGVVHNTDSSLACPDWPLCFGKVLPEMTGGVAIEHSHRLLGTLVGVLVILLTFFSRKNSSLFRRSLTALGIVIVQGLLGGLTVKLGISPLVSTFHLALSQIFVGYLLLIAVDVIAPTPKSFEPASFVKLQSKLPFLKLTVGFLFFQIVLGASLRHGGAGVACGVGPEASIFCLDHTTGAISFWPASLAAKVHLFHRIFALVVTGFVIAATIPVIKFAKATRISRLRLAAVSCHAVVCFQVALGVASVWTGLGVVPVTLHLLGASILWLLLVGILRYAQNSIESAGLFTIAEENSKR